MTGYRGRSSILEVLTMSAELERRIAAGETADKIAAAGRRAGMKFLWESGLAHVLRGESTIDELLRVVDIPAEEERTVEPAPPPPPGRAAGHGRAVPGAGPAVSTPAESIAAHF